MNEYCEGCPYWDDVNGCWQDLEPFTCPFTDEDGYFNENKYDEWLSKKLEQEANLKCPR